MSRRINFYHILSSCEHFDGPVLVRDWDKFFASMVRKHYDTKARRKALAERRKEAKENGDDCFDTIHTLLCEYEDELLTAADRVYRKRRPDGSTVWVTTDGIAYVADGELLDGAIPACFVGDIKRLD